MFNAQTHPKSETLGQHDKCGSGRRGPCSLSLHQPHPTFGGAARPAGCGRSPGGLSPLCTSALLLVPMAPPTTRRAARKRLDKAVKKACTDTKIIHDNKKREDKKKSKALGKMNTAERSHLEIESADGDAEDYDDDDMDAWSATRWVDSIGKTKVGSEHEDSISEIVARSLVEQLGSSMRSDHDAQHHLPVSYTHLTLPTICSV